MPLKTITVQIGNSDNKLTQEEWSRFVQRIYGVISGYCTTQFHACSEGSARWQNAAWVATIEEDGVPFVLTKITQIRTEFRQDSAAVTMGETKFI